MGEKANEHAIVEERRVDEKRAWSEEAIQKVREANERAMAAAKRAEETKAKASRLWRRGEDLLSLTP